MLLIQHARYAACPSCPSTPWFTRMWAGSKLNWQFQGQQLGLRQGAPLPPGSRPPGPQQAGAAMPMGQQQGPLQRPPFSQPLAGQPLTPTQVSSLLPGAHSPDPALWRLFSFGLFPLSATTILGLFAQVAPAALANRLYQKLLMMPLLPAKKAFPSSLSFLATNSIDSGNKGWSCRTASESYLTCVSGTAALYLQKFSF